METPNYKFVVAEKKITSPELLEKFTKSNTYKLIMEFIKALQISIAKVIPPINIIFKENENDKELI